MEGVSVHDSSSDGGTNQQILGDGILDAEKMLTDTEWFEQICDEERKNLEKDLIPAEILEGNELVCTSCFKKIGALEHGTLFRHPTLSVPICKHCKKFYMAGEWTRGEDGSFEHCRWCANGGELLLCDICSNAFCKKCIKRNLGRRRVTEIEEMAEWRCIVCDPKQIYKQRLMYYSIHHHLKFEERRNEERKGNQRRQMQVDFISETFKDGVKINSILKDYIDRAEENWDKKKAQWTDEDLTKVVKKIRTIIKITRINLDALEENVLEQITTSFPHIPLEAFEPNEISIPGKSGESTSAKGNKNGTSEKSSTCGSKAIVDGCEKTASNKRSEPETNTHNKETPAETCAEKCSASLHEPSEDISAEPMSGKDTEADLSETNVKPDVENITTDGLGRSSPLGNDFCIPDNISHENCDENNPILDKDIESPHMQGESNLSDTDHHPPNIEEEIDVYEGQDRNSGDIADRSAGENDDDLPTGKDKFKNSNALSNRNDSKGEIGQNENKALVENCFTSKVSIEESTKNHKDSGNTDYGITGKKSFGSLKTKREDCVDNGGERMLDNEMLGDTSDHANQFEKPSDGSEENDDIVMITDVIPVEKDTILEGVTVDDEGQLNPQDDSNIADAICGDNYYDAVEITPLEGDKKKAKVDHNLDFSSADRESDKEPESSPLIDRLNAEAKASVLRSSSSEGEEVKVDADVEKEFANNDVQPALKDDIEELRNAEAKIAVLRSTSSENEMTQKLLAEVEELSPKKRLRTKRELDKIRRKSGQITDADENSSSDENMTPKSRGENFKSKKRKDFSPVALQSWNCTKGKKTKHDNVYFSDASLPMEIDLSKIDMTGMEECRVDIARLSAEVRKQLRRFEEVDLREFPELLRGCKMGSASSDIERLCNLNSVRGNIPRHQLSDSTKDRTWNKNERAAEDRLEDMSSEEEKNMDNIPTDEEIRISANQKNENDMAKAAVLASSSDEARTSSDVDMSKATSATQDGKNTTNGERKTDGSKRSSRPALLSMRLSESETSEDEAKYREKKKKQVEELEMDIEKKKSDSDVDSDIATTGTNKRKTGKQRKHVIESSDDNFEPEEDVTNGEEAEDNSDSDVAIKKRSRRRKASSSSENSDSESEEKPKKRKRIKNNSASDSDNEDSPTKGRHKIRKVIKDKHLADETKEAAAEERDRRKRIEERQAEYNKTFKLPGTQGQSISQLVLDFDPDTKKVLVEVNKKLVSKLKPHQAEGVKFMWDACFESVAQIDEGRVPGGAILAHCMGLGKTLQTITLANTVLTNEKTKVNRMLVICPVNTVKNWEDEFDKWLKGDLEIDVYGMSGEKDNWSRADKLQAWFREGGTLIIGYDMFRNLTNEKNKKYKSKQRNIFNQCLLDPGPDIVVCDEGHLLKNEKSAINKAVNRIKTLRRIILTGTPLQNNLKEYYEMVNFVKPNLLGTRKEFMNRFVNPIVNGQHSDSTERDIRMMKKRSFILNDLLKGCMQRLDYNVLVPYLQPKLEFVLSINMTDLQKRLYRFYLDNYAKAGQVGLDGKLEGGKKGGLFYDVQNLSRIWNHPYILHLSKLRKMEKEGDEDDDELGSLKDFIDDNSSSEEGTDSDIQEVDETGEEKRRTTRQDKSDDLLSGLDGDLPSESSSKGWWNQLLSDNEVIDELKFGSKMVLLMDILKECELIGDKVLVFSQSLLSLDLIEEFLAREHEEHELLQSKGEAPAGQIGTWVQGKDYYRLDGSTGADTRKIWCKYFNKSSSLRMRLFLISTRAGGLGINLVAANRVIIFDASWNPSHDVQSIFRVYRFGQTKPVYIYRFLAKGTMEEKIYDRQVTKQSLSARVVDEQQIERHFTMNELAELYEFIDEPLSAKPLPAVPEDRLLADLVDKHKELIWKFHHHDSLLENKVDENLTEAERKSAWEEFENEKKGLIQTNVGIDNINAFGAMLQGMLPRSGDGRVMASPINPMAIQMQLKSMNPDLSHEELVMRTRAAIMQLQNLHRTQTPVIMNQNTLGIGHRQGPGYDQSFYQQEMAKAKAMINQQYPGMYRFRGGGGPAGGAMPMIRPRNPMYKPMSGPPEEITIEDDNDVVPVAMPQRRVVRPSMPRGSARGRGGRRGRPRLDPDTDMDFSPEPMNTSSAREALIQQLEAQGMSVKPSSGNES